MSLHHYWQRIKGTDGSQNEEETFHLDKEGRVMRFPYLQKIYLSLVIILAMLLSFGLGRLTSMSESQAIKIDYVDLDDKQGSIVGNREVSTGESVVASSKGAKYHYSHCPGAKQISEANKITFASAILAETAGYTLAANCSPR